MTGGNNEWSTDLFGCFDDWGSCCYGYWCTPCLFGSNAEKIDDSNCVIMCCAYCCLFNCYLCWLPHYFKRQALREKYALKENPECGDFLTTLCCGPCALCQEARELKSKENNRGVAYKPNSSPAVVTQPRADVKNPMPENQRV